MEFLEITANENKITYYKIKYENIVHKLKDKWKK